MSLAYVPGEKDHSVLLAAESKQTIEIDFQLHTSYHMRYENCDGYRYLDRKREK
jgi:hypothetical protein